MDPCQIVRLGDLMRRTRGISQIAIGLIDGPVMAEHPDLTSERVRSVSAGDPFCRCPAHQPCLHGTFIAGMLVGRRGGPAIGICPGCTLLVRPVYADCVTTTFAEPAEVARAIDQCVDEGARIINISSALTEPWMAEQRRLTHALDRASRYGVMIVAAAGNEAALTSTVLTGHVGVIPVAGYGQDGRPLRHSTIGRSIGSRGLGAPAQHITSITPSAGFHTLDGTSFAAPFVTGAAALLWSLFPSASSADIRHALIGARRRTSVVPPLLDAEQAFRTLERSAGHVRRAG